MQSVKIYPAELGVSGWLETSTYKNHQFNHEDEILDEYDYVVVGAGYGGLGAATRLKELYPNAKIAVFEALRIGSNDSGKNAGFLIDVPHKFGDDVLTPEDEKWTVRLNVFAINKMREAVKANKLDVDWSEHGKYLAAREKRFWKILDHDREILDRMNMKYDDFDRRQLAERLGTGYYSRAIFNPGSVLINPAEVVRALFTTLGPNVHIFEKTPVMQIAGSETNPQRQEGALPRCDCHYRSFPAGTWPLGSPLLSDHFVRCAFAPAVGRRDGGLPRHRTLGSYCCQLCGYYGSLHQRQPSLRPQRLALRHLLYVFT